MLASGKMLRTMVVASALVALVVSAQAQGASTVSARQLPIPIGQFLNASISLGDLLNLKVTIPGGIQGSIKLGDLFKLYLGIGGTGAGGAGGAQSGAVASRVVIPGLGSISLDSLLNLQVKVPGLGTISLGELLKLHFGVGGSSVAARQITIPPLLQGSISLESLLNLQVQVPLLGNISLGALLRLVFGIGGPNGGAAGSAGVAARQITIPPLLQGFISLNSLLNLQVQVPLLGNISLGALLGIGGGIKFP